MYSIKSLWEIFDLEFTLFGGVPETAVQMFEQDSHGHSEVRSTRENLELDAPIIPCDGEILSEMVYDFNTDKFEVI